MKTYASLRDAEYTVRSETDKCCGSCVHLETGGNALSCNRVEGNPRVVPQGICKLFESIIGDGEESEDAK